jgi:hypothetical protein
VRRQELAGAEWQDQLAGYAMYKAADGPWVVRRCGPERLTLPARLSVKLQCDLHA